MNTAYPRFSAAILLFAAAACTDTVSDVGVDLLGTEFGPSARSLALTEIAPSGLADYTGGLSRVLAGRVDDPLAGTIDATAYIGFSGAFTAGDTSTTRSAELILSRSYLYGDTLASLTLDIFNLADLWDPTGYQADTTLMTGDRVTSVTFAAADTQVTAPLPRSWLDRYDTVLRGARVDSLFRGFSLSASQGNAVVGFRLTGSRLRLNTTGGTVSFDLSRTFTGVQRSGAPMIPDNTILFQDGAGPVIKLKFGLKAYEDVPINGAVVTVTADTLEGAMAPPGFLRPQIQQLQLVAVPSDTTQPATFLGEAERNTQGTYRFQSADLTTYLQRVLVGSETFAYLEIRAPVPDNSLDVALLHTQGPAPQAHIILSQ
ncbi:MAG: hypothetical protein OXM02_02615 [Bacteroidota bacterium]|nr:hypothetical protein [Bacteroidota bacterium]